MTGHKVFDKRSNSSMSMKNGLFSIPQLFPSRIPRLFYGETSYPRKLTEREILADKLFVALQVTSYVLFAVGGLFGYTFYQFSGLIIFTALGYLIGIWMRRSLGIRGRKPTTGFFMRMRERAQGSKPGLLEWALEKISRNEFTRAECRAVIEIYEKTVKQLKQTDSTEAQNRILADLDRRVFQILYDQK